MAILAKGDPGLADEHQSTNYSAKSRCIPHSAQSISNCL